MGMGMGMGRRNSFLLTANEMLRTSLMVVSKLYEDAPRVANSR